MRIVLAILLSCGIALQAFASDGKISVPMRTTFNADKDVKIVLDSLEIFMSRDAIVKYLKQVQRNGGSNTKVLRKKMKGVCFSEINLRTDIPDDEITAIQKLLKEQIVRYALYEGNAGIKLKAKGEYFTTLFVDGDKKQSIEVAKHFYTQDNQLNFIL
ncbi:MAG: hypothetical protein RL660_2822 [Bacteroidota bacterium]